jgi:uncharacterized ParB-like nuclease family protein
MVDEYTRINSTLTRVDRNIQREILVAEIETPSQQVSKYLVSAYRLVVDQLPPISVSEIELRDGHRYRLRDGAHRLTAARSVGRQKIMAMVF